MPRYNPSRMLEAVSLLTNIPSRLVAHYLQDDKRLRQSGLVFRCSISIVCMLDEFKMPPAVVSRFFHRHDDGVNLITALADVSPIAQVHREDLTHLQSTLDIISNLVEGTTSNDVKGTNILYVDKLKTPNISIRRCMAKRILGDIPICGELLEDFLKRQEVGPAMLAKLKRVTALSTCCPHG